MYVGKLYPSYFRYKDPKTKSIKFKSRPILIIAEPTGQFDTEYIVLPVSTLSNPIFFEKEFDIQLKVCDYSKLSISRDCYVRTHKQTTMYRSNIDFHKCIGDLKTDYPEVFSLILKKLRDYENGIIEKAI